MYRRSLRAVVLSLAVAFAVFWATPAQAFPDLKAWVTSSGLPVERGDQIVIPFSVTVQNIGTEPAPPFKISVEYEVVSGGMPSLLSGALPFSVLGNMTCGIQEQQYPCLTAHPRPAP